MRSNTHPIGCLLYRACCFMLFADATLARGPHHPCSEVDVSRNKVDRHLAHDNDHMQQDLDDSHLVYTKPVSEMSEEEKSFYYFKIHDSDDNDALDGLELIHAATHHSHVDHVPSVSHDVETEKKQPHEAESEWEHVISVIDDFIAHADGNLDGYLNFVEYTSATRIGDESMERTDAIDAARSAVIY